MQRMERQGDCVQVNPAQQELKRIEEEISKLKLKFSPLPQMWEHLEAKKEGILLGLDSGKSDRFSDFAKGQRAGRKEVFDEIEKNAPYRLMNDDWYVKIKSKLLGDKQ